MKNINKGIALSLVTAIMFGIGATLAKYVLGKLNPLLLAFTALFGGFIMFLPFLFIKGRKFLPTEVSRNDVNALFKLAILGTAMPLVLILFGLNLTSSIEGAFFVQLQFIFGIIFSRILLKEIIGKRQYLGIFLMMLGSFIMALRDVRLISDFVFEERLLGDLLVVLGAVGLGYSYFLSKKLASKIKPQLVVSFRLLVGAVSIVPLLAIPFLLGVSLINFSTFGTDFFPVALVYIITNFCVAYITMQMALEMLPSWAVVATVQTMPLFTIMTSLLLLGEIVSPPMIVGGTLVLVGGLVLLVQMK